MTANPMIRTVLVASVLAASHPTVATAADCADMARNAHAASGDIARLTGIRDAALGPCDGEVFAYIDDLLGRAHFEAARAATDSGARIAHLEVATHSLGALRWRAHAALGDALTADGAHQRASEQYQLALLRLDEQGDGAAPPDIVRRVVARANAARALSPVYTRALRTRSNEPGGVAARSVAGVEIEEVPFPVEFAFDSADITENGARAVRDMYEILRDSGVRTATLVGHTDPTGSEQYNMALSQRRAEAVAQALLAMGGGFQIRVVGRGESDPPVFDDPGLYTEDERHQIMRRVTLSRR